MRGLVLAILFLFSTVRPSAGIDIPGDPSSCDLTIERGDPGNLLGDLDCSGTGANGGLRLLPGAVLNLNGHRITNDLHGIVCEVSVSPSRICTINGPGEVTGAYNGIAVVSQARIRDLTIFGNVTGIWKPYGNIANAARLDLTNVVIRDNSGDGVRGGGAIRATDSTVRDNGGVGLESFGPSRIVRTAISGNGGAGIVTGIYNEFDGRYVYSRRALSLTDSDVSGNGLSDAAADLVAAKRPRLRRSTCGTSADPTTVGSPAWGVCSGE
jgi:hypothetical protein